MPNFNILKLNDLHSRVCSYLERSGYDIVCIEKIGKHPLTLFIKKNNDIKQKRFFIWNITHGGKGRAKDEYRIQIKIPQTEKLKNNDIVLGWFSGDVFVGYDTTKHINPTWSSSMQIKLDILQHAYNNRYKIHTNKRNETIIAFHPDYLGFYIENYQDIHRIIDSSVENDLQEDIFDKQEMVEDNIELTERERTIQTISRSIRSADFRRRVLDAYKNTCSFCSLQLDIVEACHLVPVSSKLSSDDTGNGICLCANHHKAFDKGILYITNDYKIKLPDKKIRELREKSLDGGFEIFKENTRDFLRLPTDKRDYPKPEFIDELNRIKKVLN